MRTDVERGPGRAAGAGPRVRRSPGRGPRGRPEPEARPAAGEGTGRIASPVRRAGRGRPAAGRAGPGQGRPADRVPPAAGSPAPPGAGARPAVGRAPAAIARTPFIIFVTALLGGGLICLLVINTILATGSYQITSLQQAQTARAQQVQALEQQVAEESAPSVIAKRARQLGMVEPPLTKFLNLQHRPRSTGQPATEPGVPAVPGYTP